MKQNSVLKNGSTQMKLQIMNTESDATLTYFYKQVVIITALVSVIEAMKTNTTRKYAQSS